ncbi:hypothetical protein E1180_12545 [Roseibium denhamense]|uniref:Cardiolipin synthase N-terminal domain-containing protein n=1 Tax=Roseibium denhamense TaxID=76305 RepID=A0ABY1NGL4_9HYPH|nr:DUF6111 family protein [Roseibium denhamense]MTI06345.1 hypothetical protein [Roseibium denhamense]SMP08469.1 hypothetical protein SAMN06265374_0971 [Roseibium denhamense]
MVRVFLTHIILFLLPFFCYALWLWLANKSKKPGNWAKGPVAWLTVAGLILVIGGLVTFGISAPPEDKEFIPSTIENGVFVPGRYE